MKRFTAMLLTSTAVIAGCGVKAYEIRMERTLEQKKYEQKVNTYLNAAPKDKAFGENNVWVRSPKPMVEGSFMLSNPTPAMWDLAASFQGAPPPPKQANENAPPPAALPPMKLHVLARAKPKPAKKGAPAPDPAKAGRGDFTADVKALLANDFGAADGKTTDEVTKHSQNRFKRLIFQSPTNGDNIEVYFYDYNKKEMEVALIFDIPPAVKKVPMGSQAVEFCLDAFAAGRKARALFNGGSAEEAGGSPAKATEGPAF